MSTTTEESTQRLLKEEEEEASEYSIADQTPTRYSPHTKGFWILVTILIVTNLLWTLAFFTTSRGSPHKTFNEDLRKSFTASPLLNLLDLSTKPRTLEGTFNLNSSIYRQPPSEEVDKAWTDLSLSNYQLINVTAADILASGKSPTNRVRWDDSTDAYPAEIEVAHKIHCLNQIRKEIWGEHYFGVVSIHSADHSDDNNNNPKNISKNNQRSEDEYDDNIRITNKPTQTSLKGARKMHREHAMHCLHMVLQDLMCTVDVGIITHEWVSVDEKRNNGSERFPVADFSTVKQCRDFESVAAWVRENAVVGGDEKFSRLGKGWVG